MIKSLITEINFKSNLLFSPTQILNDHSTKNDIESEIVSEQGIFNHKINKDTNIYSLSKNNLTTTIIAKDNQIIIGFEKKVEGEYTNSLFLFDKKTDIKSANLDSIIKNFDPLNANEALIVNKKLQGDESIRVISSKNGLETRSNKYSGQIADILTENKLEPVNVTIERHLKEEDKINRRKLK